MMETIFITLILLLIGLYIAVRPSWSHAGPFLPDAYLIGVGLYTLGALIVEWTDVHAGADWLALMSLTAMAASLVGAIIFCAACGRFYSGINFKHIHARSRVQGREMWIINAFIIASVGVCIFFFYRLFTSPIISQFLSLSSVLNNATLRFARSAVTSGSAGYLAPGYIKQFRDTLLPLMLCAMVLYYPRPIRSTIYWGTLLVTFAAMLVMGQRFNLVLLALTLTTAAYYANAAKNLHAARKLPLRNLVLAGAVILVSFAVLSVALGRTDPTNPSNSNALFSAASGMAARIVTVVPDENVRTIAIWSHMGPTNGAYWGALLSGILDKNNPNVYNYIHLSNQLSLFLGHGPLGNSPLGLPVDVWFTWGWTGLLIVPLLYALFFGFLDLVLLSEESMIYFAIKIYMFFTMPVYFAPYQFLLYGGAICIPLILYVKFESLLRSHMISRRVYVTAAR